LVEVAVRIACKLGTTIGETVADRYEAERSSSLAPLPPGAAEALVDIAQGIADLARGRVPPNTLHNIGVRVRHVIGLAGSTPALVRAGEEVIAACEALARVGAECSAALEAGRYPLAAERAGAALQRLRLGVSRGE
jgi:hypothetical protein